MTRIDFYHLQKQNLEEVLPKLLEKAYGLDKRIKVKIGTEARVDFLNTLLWTYDPDSFLPHGSRKDGSAELQPIWLSAEDDNPNGATLLFLADGANMLPEQLTSFERVFNVFDGNNAEAVNAARAFWKALKSSGAELHYWQQDQQGRWTEK
jgi:DNA polymerase-3 subunit chi